MFNGGKKKKHRKEIKAGWAKDEARKIGEEIEGQKQRAMEKGKKDKPEGKNCGKGKEQTRKRKKKRLDDGVLVGYFLPRRTRSGESISKYHNLL